MTRPAHSHLAHPAPPRLAAVPVGGPDFIVPNHPCGCDGGMVCGPDRSRATWYDEGPDVWTICPACSGSNYHELRGVENGSRWADAYPGYAGLGGAFVARVTDSGVTIGWARSLDDARAWVVQEDWTAAGDDAELLACLGLAVPR